MKKGGHSTAPFFYPLQVLLHRADIWLKVAGEMKMLRAWKGQLSTGCCIRVDAISLRNCELSPYFLL